MTQQVFSRITIIGLGLIGSSIARAARQHGLANTLVLSDNNDATLDYARSHAMGDLILGDATLASKDADMVILAVPPSALHATMQVIAPALKPGALVMDVASVKLIAMDAAQHLPAHVYFMPTHPIAGSEQSGVAAGRADLFANKRVILTPDKPEITDTFLRAKSFWTSLGAKVDAMPPDIHDLIYGYVSHLPQLLAYAAKDTLAGYENDSALTRFLRIAGSNPALWEDIFSLNQTNILLALDRYLDALNHITSELAVAPEDVVQEHNQHYAANVLFPRIAASCLVTTVMEAEKKNGIPFVDFAGTGFADFTSPAASDPEDDLEKISSHSDAVHQLLVQYIEQLGQWRQAIA